MTLSEGIVLFSKAGVLGLMVAIPVGPVGLLIIQRSIRLGPIRGVISGLGAALADSLFGLLAALGLVALIEQLESTRHFVRPLGSLALMLVGLYLFFQRPRSLETEEVLSPTYLSHYIWDVLSTFFLTLMNPLTIIAFAALFAGSDLIPEDPREIQYLQIALGVFFGSLLWWMMLVTLAQPVKRVLSIKLEHRLHQVFGIVLLILALLSFVPRVGGVVDRLGGFVR